jgi:hypothetical protein
MRVVDRRLKDDLLMSPFTQRQSTYSSGQSNENEMPGTFFFGFGFVNKSLPGGMEEIRERIRKFPSKKLGRHVAR